MQITGCWSALQTTKFHFHILESTTPCISGIAYFHDSFLRGHKYFEIGFSYLLSTICFLFNNIYNNFYL